MYQALYRKYRPQSLDEVAGQKVITKTITNEIMHNKLSHAYLFAGPRGTGKTSIAKIIAKIINCEHPNGIKPCEECVNCTQFNLKQSTDIIEIDAASNNGVDEIRELKSKVNLVPTTGKYKIYIIDEVHMLTVGAFNALLKTLEEPPAHIIFILATTDPHKIPNTILSRCQRFDFEKISENDIVDRLKHIVEVENIQIQEDALHEIARLSDGGMRDSISMLDQVISYVDEGVTITAKEVHEMNGSLSQIQLTEFMNAFIHHDLENVFLLVDQYNQSGKNIIKLTEEIILYLRNLMLYKEVPQYFQHHHFDLDIYKNIAQEINLTEIISMIEVLNQSLNEMKGASSPKIILEMTLIKLLSHTSVQNTQSEIVKNDIKVEEVSVPSKTKIETKTVQENKRVKTVSNKEENEKKDSAPLEISRVDLEIKEKMKQVKQIRIDNALSKLDKRVILSIRQMEGEIRSKILDPEFNQVASMVMDGALKAAGNEYLVYVYPDENSSDLFNENILLTEKMFEQIFHHSYHLISTYQDDWNVIKNEFNHKLKKYEYQEETYSLEQLLNGNKDSKKEKDQMQELFGDIVEYQ